jgi:hypothetical protein
VSAANSNTGNWASFVMITLKERIGLTLLQSDWKMTQLNKNWSRLESDWNNEVFQYHGYEKDVLASTASEKWIHLWW